MSKVADQQPEPAAVPPPRPAKPRKALPSEPGFVEDGMCSIFARKIQLMLWCLAISGMTITITFTIVVAVLTDPAKYVVCDQATMATDPLLKAYTDCMLNPQTFYPLNSVPTSYTFKNCTSLNDYECLYDNNYQSSQGDYRMKGCLGKVYDKDPATFSIPLSYSIPASTIVDKVQFLRNGCCNYYYKMSVGPDPKVAGTGGTKAGGLWNACLQFAYAVQQKTTTGGNVALGG